MDGFVEMNGSQTRVYKLTYLLVIEEKQILKHPLSRGETT